MGFFFLRKNGKSGTEYTKMGGVTRVLHGYRNQWATIATLSWDIEAS